jgi:hypothetical protein
MKQLISSAATVLIAVLLLERGEWFRGAGPSHLQSSAVQVYKSIGVHHIVLLCEFKFLCNLQH